MANPNVKRPARGRKALTGGLRSILKDPNATAAEKLKAAELLIKLEGHLEQEENESSTTSALKSLL